MRKVELAKKSIESFSLDEDEYSINSDSNNLEIYGDGSILLRGEDVEANVNIDFGNT